MTHRDFAKNAPMGWNSWDCFGAAVNEKQLKENADYMAKHLKAYNFQKCQDSFSLHRELHYLPLRLQ